MLYYLLKFFEWLTPAAYLIGLAVAIWAFQRCRKNGYLVVALYFALAVFEVMAMPSINRAIQAHRSPSISQQTEEKIAAATQEAIHKVLAEEGLSYRPVTRYDSITLGPIVLVAGVWLLARKDAFRPNTEKGFKR
jgi:hypothetical protein